MTDQERLASVEMKVESNDAAIDNLQKKLASLSVDFLQVKSEVLTIRNDIVEVDGMMTKVGNFLQPYLPWIKTVITWLIIYASGYLTSHYGFPAFTPAANSSEVKLTNAGDQGLTCECKYCKTGPSTIQDKGVYKTIYGSSVTTVTESNDAENDRREKMWEQDMAAYAKFCERVQADGQAILQSSKESTK